SRLDDVEGDIDQLASRIAAVRTLCFIAQRGDWIADAAGWTAQTQDLETRLSDALHAALAQRFVDRRLALLIRDAGQRHTALPVAVGADGTVAVDGEPIGTLTGFQFQVHAQARASDHRPLLAPAEKHARGRARRRRWERAVAGQRGWRTAPDCVAWRHHRDARQGNDARPARDPPGTGATPARATPGAGDRRTTAGLRRRTARAPRRAAC